MCFALYEIVRYLIFDFWFSFFCPGVSLGLSSPSYTLNPLLFSSFKSEKGYRPMKVRRVCCIFVVVVVCWNPYFFYLSKTSGSLFHYERPYISISRSIYYSIQSSCKSFPCHPGVSEHSLLIFNLVSSRPSRLSKLLWISCGNTDQIIRLEQGLHGLFPTRRL